MSDHDDRREHERQSVFLRASLREFGSRPPSHHRVRNISEGGACLDQAEHLRPGQMVLLDIGRLEEIAATTVWTERALAGLKFAQPIEKEDAKSRGTAVPPRRQFSNPPKF